MVNRKETKLQMEDIQLSAWSVYQIVVSQNDTITLNEYSAAVDLDIVALTKKSDRTAVTNTILKNVITVTHEPITK